VLEILAHPPTGREVVHDENGRLEDVLRRRAEEENLVPMGAATDHADLGHEPRHDLLHHRVQQVEHGHVAAVPVTEAGIAVDVEQRHVDVGYRHESLEVAGETVLPVRKDDLGPDARELLGADAPEKAPVQLFLELEGPAQDRCGPLVVRKARGVAAERLEGEELAGQNLVVQVGKNFIG